MKMKRIITTILIIITLSLALNVSTAAVSYSNQESYMYASDKTPIEAPNAYRIIDTVSASDLGVNSLSDISDVFVYENYLYVLDKTQARIFVINENYKLVKELGANMQLNAPSGIFINNLGIYIADTGNKRIVKSNFNGDIITTVQKPDPKKTLSDAEFSPIKVVVDSGERLYVIVENEMNGIYQLNIEGEFLGFFGSVPVVPDFVELMWRMVSTKEQLSRMLLFVPTEYSSMDIDSDGFIYTTVDTNTSQEMRNYILGGGSDSTLAPVRRLNPKNIDVLKRNGSMPPAGDLIPSNLVDSSSDIASRFIDVSVSEDGMYCALDESRGRVFSYDKEGNLLYVFGNKGNRKNEFNNPTSVCWWGDNIVVVDHDRGEIKIFEPTDYAALINQATSTELEGDYKNSYDLWQKLSKVHPNCNIALMGIGKKEMRDGNYKEAMQWFKKADNKTYYSNAFKLYRKSLSYKIVGVIIAIIVIAVVAVFVYKKFFKENARAFNGKANKVWSGFKYSFHIIRHPFDGFWDMQHEHRGNLYSATIILLLTVLLNIISNFTTGYLLAGNKTLGYNILISGVLSVVLPLGLWCIANWSVTSLMNGSGTFKNIYMYSCYSLTPLLFGIPLFILLSNFITYDELTLYSIIRIFVFIWVGFLLFAGTLSVHQYTAMRTVITILIIIVAIGIFIFLAMLCVTIIQQMTDFIGLLIEEINLRI